MNCTKQHFDSAAGFAVHYVREHSHPIMDYTRGLIQSAAEFVIDYIKQLLHPAVGVAVKLAEEYPYIAFFIAAGIATVLFHKLLLLAIGIGRLGPRAGMSCHSEIDVLLL